MSVREDLIKAKALIDTPEKWMKDDYEDSLRHTYCALGACAETTGKQDGGEDVYEALVASLPTDFVRSAADWSGDVAQFNDHPDTTHADIMSLFDRAIAAQPVQP